MPTVPRRCRYDESRQNAVKENWRSSVAVFKPSGIVNSQTSSEAVDGLLKPISEHYFTACDEAECTELSPQKKRQDCMIFFHGSSDGDECKNCSCKKTNCLKQYCEYFASGYYCAETCSCQGCFNIPEYQDKVLATRRHIVSRDLFAFAPKILQPVGCLQQIIFSCLVHQIPPVVLSGENQPHMVLDDILEDLDISAMPEEHSISVSEVELPLIAVRICYVSTAATSALSHYLKLLDDY
ncbi:hypothetical protein ACET3Z_006242 [Daucus carota]